MLKRKKQAQSDQPAQQPPLRLWSGVVIVIVQWLIRYVIPVFVPGALAFGVFGSLICGLVIIVWWGFFSRAPVKERWGAIILIIVAMLVTPLFLHESIATGMMGMMFLIYAIPALSLAFVLWAVVSRHLSDRLRPVAMTAAILFACGMWTLLRTGGFGGDLDSDFAWRWTDTPEQRLLAQTGDEPMTLPSTPAAADTGADWSGFRGPDRDGIVHGVRIETDWTTSPPVEMWRRLIGPGWSSFSVRSGLIYTQEQRGEDEIVACYNVTTGQPVWRHRDPARFWESNGGAGPRGTPTLRDGRVYTFGGTGILNVLDAASGAVVWSRNPATDTDTKVPIWGFSSSPLVLDDIVIVAVASTLAAYDLNTGDSRWFGPAIEGDGYSSPHLLTIDGVEQILLPGAAGLISVTPGDGQLLWQHPWPGVPIVQPALTEDGDILISINERSGLRRLSVANGSQGWSIEERWSTFRIKPYFNDFVVHKGHVFGFDGPKITCIDVNNAQRKWKGKRYGGQLVLLADQDLLIVLTERGELALIEAVPDRFTELASFPAIQGKTWNHLVLADDILLVRNAQEMVAFRLSLTEK